MIDDRFLPFFYFYIYSRGGGEAHRINMIVDYWGLSYYVYRDNETTIHTTVIYFYGIRDYVYFNPSLSQSLNGLRTGRYV